MARAQSIENTISKEKLVSGRSEFDQAFVSANFFYEKHFFEFGFNHYFYKERVTGKLLPITGDTVLDLVIVRYNLYIISYTV